MLELGTIIPILCTVSYRPQGPFSLSLSLSLRVNLNCTFDTKRKYTLLKHSPGAHVLSPNMDVWGREKGLYRNLWRCFLKCFYFHSEAPEFATPGYQIFLSVKKVLENWEPGPLKKDKDRSKGKDRRLWGQSLLNSWLRQLFCTRTILKKRINHPFLKIILVQFILFFKSSIQIKKGDWRVLVYAK